jgi:hypothetical protein
LGYPVTISDGRVTSSCANLESEWWRTQSLSNPSPLRYSLLTGKRTGNFAISGLNPEFRRPVSEQIQSLQRNFLRKKTGNFSSGTGKYVQGTGNLNCDNVSVHLLHDCSGDAAVDIPRPSFAG